MATTEVIGRIDDLPDGGSRVVQVKDRTIAIFHREGQLYAIDDHCPHRGASLAEGAVRGDVVRCPWHKWEFDLATGRCVGRPGNWVRRYDVTIESGQLLIDVSGWDDSAKQGDGITRYLVRFGAMGWVRRFGSLEELKIARGQTVVVETDRGVELGEVLLVEPASSWEGRTPPQPTGELLRAANPDDISRRRDLGALPQAVIDQAQSLLDAQAEPLQIIDGERLLEGSVICLYVLGDLSSCSEELDERLSEALNAPVKLQPPTDEEPAAGGGGCGSGGCGCHSD